MNIPPPGVVRDSGPHFDQGLITPDGSEVPLSARSIQFKSRKFDIRYGYHICIQHPAQFQIFILDIRFDLVSLKPLSN